MARSKIEFEEVKQHPLFKAFDPQGKRFMKAVVLPRTLNPYLESHDLMMYALVPFGVFPHIKSIPAFQMLYEDFIRNKYHDKHTLVIPSSGNTAHGVIRLAPAFGFKKVKVPMSNDVPASKTGILRAFGDWVDVLQVGNPREVTRELEQTAGHYHLDQYAHPGNPRSHSMYTTPEIFRALEVESDRTLAVIAVAMGSSGTALGIARYLESHPLALHLRPAPLVLGVRPASGEQVPGARNEKAMADVVRLPWQESVRDVVEVSRREAFARTRRLWQAVEPQPGPTSGMAWAGLEQFLEKTGLDELRGKTSVAFICPDDGRFYSDLMLSELDPNEGVE